MLLDGQYNYVYVQTVDEIFEEIYKDMLDYEGTIQSGTVFEVVKENGSVILRKK